MAKDRGKSRDRSDKSKVVKIDKDASKDSGITATPIEETGLADMAKQQPTTPEERQDGDKGIKVDAAEPVADSVPEPTEEPVAEPVASVVAEPFTGDPPTAQPLGTADANNPAVAVPVASTSILPAIAASMASPMGELGKPFDDVKCLIIAINEFPDGVTDLRGCVNDGIREKLMYMALGIPEDRIMVLNDADATMANIQDAHEWWTSRDNPSSDNPVLRFGKVSSHGSYIKKGEQVWQLTVVADHNWGQEKYLKDTYWRDDVLSKFRPQDRLYMNFDTCAAFHVHKFMNPKAIELRIAPRLTHPPVEFMPEVGGYPRDRNIITPVSMDCHAYAFACNSFETASDAYVMNTVLGQKQYAGAFSNTIQELFFAEGKTKTIGQIQSNAVNRMNAIGFRQNPQKDMAEAIENLTFYQFVTAPY